MGDFAAFLEAEEDEAAVMAIRRSRSTGRPVGAGDGIAALEARTERALAAGRRGPKPKERPKSGQDDLFHTVAP